MFVVMKSPLKLLLCGAFVLFSIAQATSAQDNTVSITQKATGKSIDVIIEGVENGSVKFKMPGGNSFQVPASSLTADSIERIKSHMERASAPSASEMEAFSELNKIIGHELFGQAKSLWEEPARDVAQRLKLRMESEKENSSSYRLYTQMEYQFLGAHPYCVTLYGGPDHKSQRFSLVFANKGDFGSRMGLGEDHFKEIYPDKEPPGDLNEAIELDAEVLTETLTTGIGAPEEQYYGEGDDRRKVTRWDFGDHAFLLSTEEDEYTSLLIVPTSNADVEGKVDFIVDADFRKMQIKNLRKEENGDVWIDNIPMVNQGPKGYCAPATFERAMRYMFVPADMYLLATAATAPGGGTNTTKLSEDCKRLCSSKARRIRELDLSEDFDLDTIRRYLDKGVPVLWQMCSLEQYNQIANDRTQERESVSDFSAWASEIESEAVQVSPTLSQVKDNFHICMITGYNEATNEVAVSDSWGPRYELRWVHLDIARAVTSRGGFVIDF